LGDLHQPKPVTSHNQFLYPFHKGASALFSTLLQVAGGVMMPLGGWLTDLMARRWGRVRPIFIGLAGSGVMLAASTWMVSPVAVLTLITAAYGLVVACEGAFWWAVLTNSADSPGAGYGLANGIGNAAQFVAPLLMPWIAARWGWDAAVWSVALALAGAAAFWVSTYSASWRPLRSSS
jgi:MFS family permease